MFPSQNMEFTCIDPIRSASRGYAASKSAPLHFSTPAKRIFFVLFAFRWFSIILQGLIIVVWRDETIVEAWAKKKMGENKVFHKWFTNVSVKY